MCAHKRNAYYYFFRRCGRLIFRGCRKFQWWTAISNEMFLLHERIVSIIARSINDKLPCRKCRSCHFTWSQWTNNDLCASTTVWVTHQQFCHSPVYMLSCNRNALCVRENVRIWSRSHAASLSTSESVNKSSSNRWPLCRHAKSCIYIILHNAKSNFHWQAIYTAHTTQMLRSKELSVFACGVMWCACACEGLA